MNKIQETIDFLERENVKTNFLLGKNTPTDAEIFHVEKHLGVKFSPSYSYFLKTIGRGMCLGREFYGILNGKLEEEIEANAYWFTKELNQKDNMPSNLFVIENLDDGVYACLDFNQINEGEAAVVEWDMGGGEPCILAATFGYYFFNALITDQGIA